MFESISKVPEMISIEVHAVAPVNEKYGVLYLG
jgi:hypothetical protein